MTLSDFLKEKMVENNWSVAELARFLEIQSVEVDRILKNLTNKKLPSERIQKKICTKFKLSPQELADICLMDDDSTSQTIRTIEKDTVIALTCNELIDYLDRAYGFKITNLDIAERLCDYDQKYYTPSEHQNHKNIACTIHKNILGKAEFWSNFLDSSPDTTIVLFSPEKCQRIARRIKEDINLSSDSKTKVVKEILDASVLGDLSYVVLTEENELKIKNNIFFETEDLDAELIPSIDSPSDSNRPLFILSLKIVKPHGTVENKQILLQRFLQELCKYATLHITFGKIYTRVLSKAEAKFFNELGFKCNELGNEIDLKVEPLKTIIDNGKEVIVGHYLCLNNISKLNRNYPEMKEIRKYYP